MFKGEISKAIVDLMSSQVASLLLLFNFTPQQQIYERAHFVK